MKWDAVHGIRCPGRRAGTAHQGGRAQQNCSATQVGLTLAKFSSAKGHRAPRDARPRCFFSAVQQVQCGAQHERHAARRIQPFIKQEASKTGKATWLGRLGTGYQTKPHSSAPLGLGGGCCSGDGARLVRLVLGNELLDLQQ